MKTYPKLRYPIHTKGLSLEDRALLLAYDIVYRTKHLEKIDVGLDDLFLEDIDSNLANLGHLIEKNICGMDLKLRFEGYDDEGMTTPIGVDILPNHDEALKTLK